MNSFFRTVVTDALNPLLDLLSKTLLTTPTLDQLPRIGELWNSSWEILLAVYALLILVAGILVMGYETLQSRTSIKEIAPRIVGGFLAGALSLWISSKAIEIANALATALMAGGLDASSAGDTLKNLVLNSLNGGIWVIFIGLFLAGMLIVLLVTYVVRVALTVILIAGAPLALMFHALPHTDGIARTWWTAFTGCLAIQVAQSLTLITAMRVFLAPGGFTLFGPTASGLVNLLVSLALIYILLKIPFWILGSVRSHHRGSLAGSLLKGFIAAKTFGLLGGLLNGKGGTRAAAGAAQSAASASPYAKARTTADGQYMLPLTGVKRGRLPKPPHLRYPPKKPARKPAGPSRGKQLAFPADGEWPENKPVRGPHGQWRLPLPATRVPRSPQPLPPPGPRSGQRDRQLAFPADGEWPENKPALGRDGQYRLPLRVRRMSTPTPNTPTPPARGPSTAGQLRFPAGGEWPENKPRLGRDGQYRFPLRVQRARPPSPPTGGNQPPASQATRKPPVRQQPLPLNLPKVHPTRPSTRRGGDDT